MSQVIIEFLTGVDDADITEGTAALQDLRGGQKFTFHQGEEVGAREGLADALQSLNNGGRLYLRGHGDWEMKTLGGRKPEVVIKCLSGLTGTSNVTVSVTGCLL